MTGWPIGGLLAGLVLLASAAPAGALLPRPPCGAEPIPGYPQPGEQPNVILWAKPDLSPDLTPPSCTPWPAGAATIVVGLAGRFHYADSANALLARIGAISSLSKVRYWSVTEKQWNNMFTRAVALDGPNHEKKRADFSAAELLKGGEFYFAAADNRSGKDAVSRLRVIAADDVHLVLETENVTPLRWTVLTYASPGNFQTWYFLDRDAAGCWRFYSLTRVLYASSLLSSVIPNKSYINRSVAMYRHFRGLPTDRDPPAAP